MQAREQISQYGDEIDEVIEYGMVLPHSISALDEHRSSHPIMTAIPVHQSERMQNDEYAYPMHPSARHSGSPIHTFNEMEKVYYNLASR